MTFNYESSYYLKINYKILLDDISYQYKNTFYKFEKNINEFGKKMIATYQRSPIAIYFPAWIKLTKDLY